MIVAFAIWGNRIAPVFDVARYIHLVGVEAGRVLGEKQESLPDEMTTQKALHLAELNVETLVYGAISRPIQAMVAAYGIQVIPFVAGGLREIVQAWLSGGFDGDTFAMPGCCGQGRRRRKEMSGRIKEKYLMNGRRHGRMGRGGGQGQGQSQGRMGGLNTGGIIDNCLCPKCGHRELYKLGEPCVQKRCPKCGTALIRE